MARIMIRDLEAPAEIEDTELDAVNGGAEQPVESNADIIELNGFIQDDGTIGL